MLLELCGLLSCRLDFSIPFFLLTLLVFIYSFYFGNFFEFKLGALVDYLLKFCIVLLLGLIILLVNLLPNLLNFVMHFLLIFGHFILIEKEGWRFRLNIKVIADVIIILVEAKWVVAFDYYRLVLLETSRIQQFLHFWCIWTCAWIGWFILVCDLNRTVFNALWLVLLIFVKKRAEFTVSNQNRLSFLGQKVSTEQVIAAYTRIQLLLSNFFLSLSQLLLQWAFLWLCIVHQDLFGVFKYFCLSLDILYILLIFRISLQFFFEGPLQFLCSLLFLLAHMLLYLLLLYLFLFYFFLSFAILRLFTLLVAQGLILFCSNSGTIKINSSRKWFSNWCCRILFTAYFGLFIGLILHQPKYLRPDKSVLNPLCEKHPFFVVHTRIVFNGLLKYKQKR